MRSICPKEPSWRVEWEAINDRYPWIREMQACPQDPVYHAEGDVWTHVRMVCEALAELPDWRALPRHERDLVFWGALLHDAAKPSCTKRESDGHITSRGHAIRGARIARRILWEQGMPFGAREQIVNMVRYHHAPFWMMEREDPRRHVLKLSQNVRCDLLTLLAGADARGRICQEGQDIVDNVDLFEEMCREYGCLQASYLFCSEHARFLYFRDLWDHPDVKTHEGFRTSVVLMSGFPGAGKDHWIQEHLPDRPVVSLDAIRRQLGVAPTDPQGSVVQEAREQARAYLREGMAFVWNATNISRQLRDQCVRLFKDYRARIRIVYVEVSPDRLAKQNRQREHPVPNEVIGRLLQRWDVPDPYEAHSVDYVVDGQAIDKGKFVA